MKHSSFNTEVFGEVSKAEVSMVEGNTPYGF